MTKRTKLSEFKHFNKLANEWWSKSGKYKILHKIKPIRIKYILNHITSKNYKTAVIKTIKAGGCNCSRANFVGAYFAAANGVKNIPLQWINKTKSAKSIIK